MMGIQHSPISHLLVYIERIFTSDLLVPCAVSPPDMSEQVSDAKGGDPSMRRWRWLSLTPIKGGDVW